MARPGQGAEFIDALLSGGLAAMFGGVGNVQKFPTRLAANSIGRTVNNPVFGEPHPRPVQALRHLLLPTISLGVYVLINLTFDIFLCLCGPRDRPQLI